MSTVGTFRQSVLTIEPPSSIRGVLVSAPGILLAQSPPMTIFDSLPALPQPVSTPNSPQIEWPLELGIWTHNPLWSTWGASLREGTPRVKGGMVGTVGILHTNVLRRARTGGSMPSFQRCISLALFLLARSSISSPHTIAALPTCSSSPYPFHPNVAVTLPSDPIQSSICSTSFEFGRCAIFHEHIDLLPHGIRQSLYVTVSFRG